jgi:hypothetical protein
VRRGGSRILILLLVLTAAVIAIAPVIIGRGHGVQVMREGLQGVLDRCRTKYTEARTAADSARVDEWVPPVMGVTRSGDPPCGKYRRRNMLGSKS